MSAPGEAVFAAAQAMVGSPFRLHGRDRATGLDCVGLVWAAYRDAGLILSAPDHYPLRGWTGVRVTSMLDTSGLVRVVDAAMTGDVVLIDAGAGQWHLAIWGADSHVHAHAALRRVVETPGPPAVVSGIWGVGASRRCAADFHVRTDYGDAGFDRGGIGRGWPAGRGDWGSDRAAD